MFRKGISGVRTEARRSSLEDMVVLLCGKLRRVSRRCWPRFERSFLQGLTVVLGFEVSETEESLVLAGENKRKGFVFPSVLSPYLVKLGFNPQSTISVCTLLPGTIWIGST